VSRYQKYETNLDFTEARDSEWQWHQLGRMQVCTLLQTDNHASTPPLSFYRPDALPAAQPAASRERGGNVHDVDVDTFVNIALCCMYMCMNFDAVAWGKIDAYETKSKGSPYSITKRTVP